MYLLCCIGFVAQAYAAPLQNISHFPFPGLMDMNVPHLVRLCVSRAARGSLLCLSALRDQNFVAGGRGAGFGGGMQVLSSEKNIQFVAYSSCLFAALAAQLLEQLRHGRCHVDAGRRHWVAAEEGQGEQMLLSNVLSLLLFTAYSERWTKTTTATTMWVARAARTLRTRSVVPNTA